MGHGRMTSRPMMPVDFAILRAAIGIPSIEFWPCGFWIAALASSS
jgi:hypothetical protein